MPFQGFLRNDQAISPAWTKHLILFGETFPFQQLEQEQNTGFLLLAAFLLRRVGKDQEGEGEEMALVLGAGDGDTWCRLYLRESLDLCSKR